MPYRRAGSSAPSYTVEPPWATNFSPRPNSRVVNPGARDYDRVSNPSRNGTPLDPRTGRPGYSPARWAESPANRGMTPEVDVRIPSRRETENERVVERRYGERPIVPPEERDIPYRNGISPYSPPSGTDSHREREARRREERERAERRERREADARYHVPPEVPAQKNVLTILGVDMHVPENTRAHRTDQYDCTERELNPRLVVRRGQVFRLTFFFQRDWNSSLDDFYLQFTIGEDPSVEEGTMVFLLMDETESGSYSSQTGWAAKFGRSGSRSLSVMVYPPPNSIVGEWECKVATRLTETKESFVYEGIGDIYVIFNPWCEDDQVYYGGNPSDLNEYVLNEYGCVFEGQADYLSRKPWFYGQFRDGILDVTMTILRLAFEGKVTREMSDVIMVSRRLTRMLNHSRQDPGVMIGNWSNDYSDGTSPSTWTGSVKILKEFQRTARPVKYAQCWVFSHVLTTVCRALGIPCRSITNYESAHDTDKTATIDKYVNEEGDELPGPNKKADSVWNFHCWNDIWINRPDLDRHSDKVYSGWHAIDATPQERSHNRYQCGPSPVTAIKHGELSVGYDTIFIFGEVNGEMCTWLIPKDGAMQLIERDPNRVGQTISTKRPDGGPARGTFNPGSRRVHEVREDITHLYKFPEGSPEEREALEQAVGRGIGAAIFNTPGGVKVDIPKIEDTMVGDPFVFKAVLTNGNRLAKTILKLTLAVYPCDYRGERIGWGTIAYQTYEEFTLEAGGREVIEEPVHDRAYLSQCDNAMAMMLRVSAKVNGEEKPITKMRKFVLRVPDLTITTSRRGAALRRDQPFPVSILVTNPCSKPLTGCTLHLDGSVEPVAGQGFEERDTVFVKRVKDIFPNQQVTINVEVKANAKPLGNPIRQLEVDFSSRELPDMTGSLELQLQ